MTATITRGVRGVRACSGKPLMVLGVATAVFVLFFPARHLIEQRTQKEQLQHRLAALEAENQRLSTEVDRLNDPAELEGMARERLGLVKPGEDAYYFSDPSPTPGVAAPEQTPHRSRIARAWSWLVRLVGGSG